MAIASPPSDVIVERERDFESAFLHKAYRKEKSYAAAVSCRRRLTRVKAEMGLGFGRQGFFPDATCRDGGKKPHSQ